MNEKPKLLARYDGTYTITQGVTNGMYYVFERDVFVGMDASFDNAVDLIALREGMYFEPEKIEDLR